MFLLVDVFLFFSRLPSHISETFTYGSVQTMRSRGAMRLDVDLGRQFYHCGVSWTMYIALLYVPVGWSLRILINMMPGQRLELG